MDKSPHCADEKTEAWRGQVTHPRSHSSLVRARARIRTSVRGPLHRSSDLLSAVLSTAGLIIYSGRDFQHLSHTYYLQRKG